jgi:hypothetical protein
MPQSRSKKTRQQQIDEAVDSASGVPEKKPVKPKKKNPYKPGSARAKLWARREADKRDK